MHPSFLCGSVVFIIGAFNYPPFGTWKDSWFGPYIVHSQNVYIGEEVYEASAYWVVGSRAYQLVLSGGAEGRAAPDSINLFLCSSK